MLNPFRLAIAVLLLGVSFAPGVARADHKFNGCPQGYTAEISGQYSGDLWVKYVVRMEYGDEYLVWDHFDYPEWMGEINYPVFASVLDIDRDDARVVEAQVFTQYFHWANLGCWA